MSDASKPKARRPASEAQIAANRGNARKSPGPRTPEGKLKSCRNSLKHGFRAAVLDIPGEDPEVVAERFALWSPELNPDGDHVGDFLVLLAARKATRLDRLDSVHDARAGQFARDALKDRFEARAREVEELLRTIKDRPDVAVRRLRTTSDGCHAIINECDNIKHPLIGLPTWDAQDADLAYALRGDVRPVLREAPHGLYLPTRAIDAHRKAAAKLKANEGGGYVDYAYKYYSDLEHQKARDGLVGLEAAKDAAVAGLSAMIEAHQSELRDRARALEVEAAGATYRRRFDVSDECRLIHLYEVETERGLLKALETLASRRRDAAKYAEQDKNPGLATNDPSRPSPSGGPAPTPNEAKSAGGSASKKPPESVFLPDCTLVKMTIVPEVAPKDRR